MPTHAQLVEQINDDATTADELVVIADELAAMWDDLESTESARDLLHVSKALAVRIDADALINVKRQEDAAQPLPEKRCDHCLQRWDFQEPEPLSPECTHGGFGDARMFATCARVGALKGDRIKLQLDVPGGDDRDGEHVVCILTAHSAKQLRRALGSVVPGGTGVMVTAWKAELSD